MHVPTILVDVILCLKYNFFVFLIFFFVYSSTEQGKKSIYTASNTLPQIVIVLFFMIFVGVFAMIILIVTQQNFHEWHEWWTNCNDVRLMTPEQNVLRNVSLL